MNNVAIFEHPQFGQMRTETINDEPWFCASDVCKVLSFKQRTESALRSLDDDEKLMRKVSALESRTPSNRGNWFINESGLYNLIFGSSKPEAKAFRKWVTSEVLPAIRRTGSYTPQPLKYMITSNQQLAQDMTMLVLRELMKVDSRPVRTRIAGLLDFYTSQIK